MHDYDEKQKISAMDAFAVALPYEFLKLFKEWLNTAVDKETAAIVSFDDIIEFLRCEIVLRLFGISSAELKDFDMTEATVESYGRVRTAMTSADRPASARPVLYGSAGIEDDEIDPIITKLIEAMNGEWKNTFFVSGVSSMDIDDDKIPNYSRKWTSYGFKRTPTKDKKLKPVIHVSCTTGSGHIVNICPDTNRMKLSDMLPKTINDLMPHRDIRPLHGFFIDRGYLELAKEQHVDISNLIQIMREMGVKFLGTVKNSLKYPFYFVEVTEDGKTEINKRAVVQTYRMRNTWNATSKSATQSHDVIQATVMRHGGGKTRAARITTSLPEAMNANAYVYETNSMFIDRLPHGIAPQPLPEDASQSNQISRAWKQFRFSFYSMVRTQGSPDWMACRPWRFTSTSFHHVVNLERAEYINTTILRELHTETKSIIQLAPTTSVTYENAIDLDDEYLPMQRSGLHVHLASDRASQKARHSNCTTEYWLRQCSNRKEMVEKCDEYGIDDHPNEKEGSRKQFAEILAANFRQLAQDRENIIVLL